MRLSTSTEELRIESQREVEDSSCWMVLSHVPEQYLSSEENCESGRRTDRTANRAYKTQREGRQALRPTATVHWQGLPRKALRVLQYPFL